MVDESRIAFSAPVDKARELLRYLRLTHLGCHHARGLFERQAAQPQPIDHAFARQGLQQLGQLGMRFAEAHIAQTSGQQNPRAADCPGQVPE